MHPEFDYALVRTAKGLLILADSLREAALTRYGLDDGAEVIAHTTGAALEGLLLQHPFYERQVPVIWATTSRRRRHRRGPHRARHTAWTTMWSAAATACKVDNPVGDDGKFYAERAAGRRHDRSGRRTR